MCHGERKEEQEQKTGRTLNYLFTDIKQCFEELFVDTPEDVKVKHKETTDPSIFISLVNL